MAATALEVRNLTAREVSSAASLTPDSRPLTLADLSEPPQWLSVVLKQLRELSELRENWDSYGGREIGADSLNLASQVLSESMFSALGPPAIVPTSIGGVQAEWRSGRRALEIEFHSDFTFEVLFSDADQDREEEITLDVDLTKMQPFIRELAR